MMFAIPMSYETWAELVPWQRDDIVTRYTKYCEEQKKLMDEEAAKIKAHK